MPVGTLVLPPTGKVENLFGYGADGTELVGTRTDAATGDVRAGTEYGDPDSPFTGTLIVPTVPTGSGARILDVCDGVLSLIDSVWTPAGSDDASRLYAVSERKRDIEGKKVRVFPAAYSEAERLARRRVSNEYRVAVEVEEMYTEPASSDEKASVPIEWVDERVVWVAENIYGLLNATGVRGADRLLGSLYPATCEVDTVYEPLALDQDKIFRSQVTVTYRENAEG